VLQYTYIIWIIILPVYVEFAHSSTCENRFTGAFVFGDKDFVRQVVIQYIFALQLQGEFNFGLEN